jgi:hypothetical protein
MKAHIRISVKNLLQNKNRKTSLSGSARSNLPLATRPNLGAWGKAISYECVG